MKWIRDSAGDFVNLEHIEYITFAPVPEESVEPDIPDGHTHQILAVNTDQESYTLFTGTEVECRTQRNIIESFLGEVC